MIVETLIGGALGGCSFLVLSPVAKKIGNDTVVYTILIGLSMIIPTLGVGLIIGYLVANCLISVIKGSALITAINGGGYKQALIHAGLGISVVTVIFVVSLFSGTILSWLSFGSITTAVSIGLIVNNIRVLLKEEREEGKGIFRTIRTTLLMTIVSIGVLTVSEVLGIGNLIAIVCIIFGQFPGGGLLDRVTNVNERRYEDVGTDNRIFGGFLGFIIPMTLAIGGVNPYLLLNGTNGLIKSLIIMICSEIVPIGKWLSGQDTGKTLITELLKSQAILPFNHGFLILLSLILTVVFLTTLILKSIIVRTVEDYVKDRGSRTKEMGVIGDILVVFFLGVSSGLVGGLGAVGLLIVIKSVKIDKWMPPALASSLPGLIIAFS